MTAAARDVSTATAKSPGKVILFGEHAINCGQPALAASVGLYARCTVLRLNRDQFQFRSGVRESVSTRDEILTLARQIDDARANEKFEFVRTTAKADFFAPQKYALAPLIESHAHSGLLFEWQSEVPASSGLGSGGSAFTAMIAAVAAILEPSLSVEQLAALAHRGDIVAHGGIASALDTQTCLLGGVIRFTGQGLAEPVLCAPGMTLVIGNTNVHAATGEVNGRVRAWLNEKPVVRLQYFKTIGALSRAAIPLLARGDWDEVGRLMNLNQLVLEKIGVSSPEIDRLIDAALAAGALGAKISGSGGGGIVIWLSSSETKQAVFDAINGAGGTALMPAVAVPGVSKESSN